MKIRTQWMALLALCLMAPVAGYANDSITGLPVYPGIGSPEPLPKATFCGKQMDGSFYIVMNGKGEKVKLVAAWYAKRLTGFHVYHANTDGRTQDTFFNKDGTKEVTITSSRGNVDEVFSVSYGNFRPGLSAEEMASFNQGKRPCRWFPASVGDKVLSGVQCTRVSGALLDDHSGNAVPSSPTLRDVSTTDYPGTASHALVYRESWSR